MLRMRIYLADADTLLLQQEPLESAEWTYTLDLIRGFPEKKWSRTADGWKVASTSRNIAYLRQYFRDDEWEADEEASVRIRYGELTERSASIREKRRWQYLFEGTVPPYEWNASREPYKHQIVAADAAADTEFFAWLMEQGTGKTLVSIEELVREARIRKAARLAAGKTGGTTPDHAPVKALVLCPRTLCPTWLRELNLSVPKDLTLWARRMGSQDVGVGDLIDGMRAKADLKVWITNYERIESILDALKKMQFDFGIADEFTALKNPSAKRTKAALQLRDTIKRRRGLTGTILANSILDVYTPFEWLNQGALGYGSFYAYRHEFARYIKVAGGWEKMVGIKNLDILKERMARYSFVVKKEQCLDLPAKSYQTIAVEPSPAMRRVYQSLTDFFFALLEEDAGPDGTVEAKNVAAKLVRLSQVTSGFVRTQDGSITRLDGGDAKLLALKEIIEGASGKVLVWARFREDIRFIADGLEEAGIASVQIHGSVPPDARDAAVTAFNSVGGPRVLIGEPGTGGIGLTLLGFRTEDFPDGNPPAEERCHTVVYYSQDWSLQKREQSEDRCHRIGLRDPVSYYDLTIEGTIDEVVAEAVQNKRSLAQSLKNMDTVRDVLLGKKQGIDKSKRVQRSLADMRALLHEQGIVIPVPLGKTTGCEDFDHTDEEGRMTLRCPHCTGDPMTAPAGCVQEFLQGNTFIEREVAGMRAAAQDLVNKANADGGIVMGPEFKKKLEAAGVDPDGLPPEEDA